MVWLHADHAGRNCRRRCGHRSSKESAVALAQSRRRSHVESLHCRAGRGETQSGCSAGAALSCCDSRWADTAAAPESTGEEVARVKAVAADLRLWLIVVRQPIHSSWTSRLKF